MAWIESHQDIGQHPKTIALAGVLGERITTVVGILHLLWHFTLKFAWRDGDLSKFTPEIISGSVFWHREPEVLIDALQKTAWLDKMMIHGWMDYAGKIVKDRRYNEERRKTSLNAVLRRKTSATLPNQRQRLSLSLKRQRPPIVPQLGDDFDAFWKAYPRKVGKDAAKKIWLRKKPPLSVVLKALNDQAQSEQWKRDGGQFIPHPATWLNQGRWQDEAPKLTIDRELVL